MRFVVFATEEPRTPKTGVRATRHIRGWRPEASGRPANTGNISATASYPRPVLASVAQALLPVSSAWEASALGAGKSACATPGSRPPGRTGMTNSQRLFLTGWNLPCAVDDSKDVDLIRLDVIDDPKGPFQNLTNLWDRKFRDFAP